jgi:ABC-type Fe3+/spermidine/putrescine transport system ATPase subunit
MFLICVARRRNSRPCACADAQSSPSPAWADQPLALKGIAKSFEHGVKGRIFAVKDVDLDVVPGELLTLLGPSGCGKTTTLRMIAGFEQPTQGSIHIGERDVTGLRANERNIGFVFQNYAIFPHLSVFENVGYGLRVQKKPEAEVQRAVQEVLELIGLAGYAQQQPHQLSGGEQQRIALARAIVFRPRILLFDEPLSNLDAKLRVQMRSEILQLQKRLNITTVYVTHDQEEAMAISDRIAVMDRGSIAQIASAEDLYDRPKSEFVKATVWLRIVNRTNAYSHVAINGVDPFTKKREKVEAGVALKAETRLASDRDSFSDLPSREVHFYRTEADWRANKPALNVYYLGVPDTTPEFSARAAMDQYLDTAKLVAHPVKPKP